MNVVLSDMESTPLEFMESLKRTTGMKWTAIDWQSNQMRTGKASEARRYLKYIFKPLSVVFRKDVENIVAWQQFYGISFAFWSRLLQRPKTARLTVMTFIYKPKDGWIGNLYKRFIRYAVTSRYIDTITCSSSDECNRYAEIFGVPREKFTFVPWCIEDHSTQYHRDPSRETEYILGSGRSNRDWPLLIESVRDTEYRVKIIDDTFKSAEIPENVQVFNNVSGGHALQYLANSWAFVIPIDTPDVSAGQTVLLTAWSFGIPVVCTRGKGLSDDYIEDGVDALLVDKDPVQLRAALDRLRDDPKLYECLAQNGRKKFEENYTEKALGRNVGQTFIERE